MTSDNMKLLELRRINASASDVQLLHNIDLDVSAGEILALIGPNGAGKSSLLRAMVGDLSCSSGELLIGGRPIASYKVGQLAKHMAYLPQASDMNFPFESLDVVLMGRIPHSTGVETDRSIAYEALQTMDVGHLAHRLYTRLSGGERQRVQLARVMSQLWRAQDTEHRLLVLDEPCAGLDIAHTQQLMQCLRRMAADGVAIIMVVHDFTLAARNASSIAAINNGNIVKQGSASEVINRLMMKELFQVDASIMPHPKTGYPVVCIDD